LIRSFIVSRFRDLRTVVMCEEFGVLVTARAREFWMKKARRNFEELLAINIRSDSKSFYAYVCSKSKSKVQVGPLIDSHGRQISYDKDPVSHFNKYVSMVFIKEDLINIPKPVPVHTDLENNRGCFDLKFDVSDVANALDNY